MSNKTKILLLALLILIVAGYLVYRGQVEKQNQAAQSSAMQSSFHDSFKGGAGADEEAVLDEDSEQELQAFNARCESGEWIEIANVQGETISLAGKLRRVYPEDDIAQNLKSFEFFVEGKEKTALSGSDLSAFDNFEDRDVEVRGVRSADGKSVAATQARCAGAETDKNAIDSKVKLMSWLAANIASVAPKKAPYQKWLIDSVEFVDGKNVYAEYYDAVEDDESSEVDADTSRKVLLEMNAKADGSFEAKVLAYWEAGEEDLELKSGADKFEDAVDTSLFQYDPEEKSWTRI